MGYMRKRYLGLAALLVIVTFGVSLPVSADNDPLQSAHYRFDESVVGGSGLDQESSGSYQLGELIGDLAVGGSTSSNFQLNSGFFTSGEPALTFIVDDSGVNFGSFSAATATVATSTFEVIDYTSYGYIVQVYGTPPTNGSHTITPLAAADVSQAGVEQFGINLVANTSPVNVGANPDNGQFGFGQAASNYNIPNNYRYVNGDTIALAPKSSGDTIYTISYLVNVSGLTPGGQYTSNQTLVCIGTY